MLRREPNERKRMWKTGCTSTLWSNEFASVFGKVLESRGNKPYVTKRDKTRISLTYFGPVTIEEFNGTVTEHIRRILGSLDHGP